MKSFVIKNYLLFIIIFLAAFLRLYKLGSIPPSLYWDEASLGYNAYSILKSAHDEHGRFLPITNFPAFGDYKPPGYIYAAVPSIAIFGLNEFAIRFPSALFGVLTVLVTYFLAKKLFEKEAIAALAAFFLAISPWHLQFSRGAFEANLGLFFSTLAIYLFFKFAKDSPIYILPSALSFIAAMYTFTGQRLFVPLIVLILAVQFRKQIMANIKITMLTIGVSLVLIWPLFRFVTGTIEGRLRFDEVTIFKDLKPINDSIEYRKTDQFALWANIIHNRRFFYAHEYLIHYFDAFDPRFLFSKGDVNPRLSIQEVGGLYYFDLILILTGSYFLFSQRQKYRFFVIGWLLISPLGPAMARETPHALRMIHILPTFQLIGAFGFYYLYQQVKFKKLFLTFSFLIFAVSFLYYLHMYFYHWPKIYSGEWQYGYKQAVEIVKSRYTDVDHVVVTNALGRPYIYFLLYMKIDPADYLKTAQVERDRFFFFSVGGFGKFIFSNSPQDVSVSGKILYVTTSGQIPSGAIHIATIKNRQNQEVFEITQINK